MNNKIFEPGQGFTQEDWDAVENPELTQEQLAQAKPFAEAFPELAANFRRRAGRPKLDDAKEAVTLRLAPQTLARFKARGDDWRRRMSEILDKAEL